MRGGFTRMVTVVTLGVALAAVVAAYACGPKAPSFDDGSGTTGTGSTSSDCCCKDDMIVVAMSGTETCPPGFTHNAADRCPHGANYPNESCNFNWVDAGAAPVDDGGADSCGDASAEDCGGGGFCCCAGAQTANPVADDGGLGCPEGYLKLTPDLCPGGKNYPNGMCGQ